MPRLRQLVAGLSMSIGATASTPADTVQGPGAVVLPAESDGHVADAALRQALIDPDPRTRLIGPMQMTLQLR